MLCTRCKKRPAVIFLTKIDSGETINEGLCITCAHELGIKQVDDIVKKMGLNEEDIDNMNNQFSNIIDNASDEDGTDSQALTKKLLGVMDNIKISDGKNKNFQDKNFRNKKEVKRKFLDNYCVNLNQKAREGKVDRVIGREKEEQRIVQILNRRTKNNVCLIGEPGVGKTAIAEEIARKIVDGDVPYKLIDKEIFLLDLTALVAGTQFRGQFESRVKNLVDEIKAARNIILFIDEVHNLVGTGDSEGTMNAANILKPALSRGDIQVIGATTFTEYRKYIEKDSALERRFQPITINEPNIEQTINILNGIKEYYELYHHVKISKEIVNKIVNLSERYISDRFLPDKAIDLLDEACSSVALNNLQLEQYNKLKLKLAGLKQEELENEDVSEENKEINYELSAQLKAECLQCEKQIEALEKDINNIYITEDTLANVVELWAGIPAAKIKENEFSKLKNLCDTLKNKIVGQDKAIEELSTAVIRSKVKIIPNCKPISFIFVGPTGVGKTELAKLLANELFSDVTDPLIKLDMSEFMEKHTVSKLIGAPPGYVGYDEAGQLTEKIRRRPYTVILFDEIEKAHPDVMNILLQTLDEGKLTDSQGREISFEHVIIIMTSNAGSNIHENVLGFNKSADNFAKNKMLKALSDFLRPEFLARVDEIIAFNTLTILNYEQITIKKLDEFSVNLKKHGIEFYYDSNVVNFIANKAFANIKTGVRGIIKIIKKEVEDKICQHVMMAKDEQIKEITLKQIKDALSLKCENF